MDDKYLKHVVVLGAAGKMGKGIALLLLEQMAWIAQAQLILIDQDRQSFAALKIYLRENLIKNAERNINKVRQWGKQKQDLIDNEALIEAFVSQALDNIVYSTSIEDSQGALLVFEAIIEDVSIKVSVFQKIKPLADKNAYYFTNTSSIPIHILQEKSGLNERLIGFHFYNPPAVQKLLELIIPDNVEEHLTHLASDLANKFKKVVVLSHDKAGFIGNGHFIREILFACSKMRELAQSLPFNEAIETVNTVSQFHLVRPMGIFQLIDYVGIDVCRHIAGIMTTFLNKKSFVDPFIDALFIAGVRGGQHADGSQREGIFKYENGHPVAVYDSHQKIYIALDQDKLTHYSTHYPSWKALSKDLEGKIKLDQYFKNLWTIDSKENDLAKQLLSQSKQIAYELVSDKVANCIEDVDNVLKNGFFHLYGVDQPFISLMTKGEKE